MDAVLGGGGDGLEDRDSGIVTVVVGSGDDDE